MSSGNCWTALTLGGYAKSNTPQMMKAAIMDTGRETANQVSQEGAPPSRDICSIAKMFWGLLMGLVMPPKLLAKAIPAMLQTVSFHDFSLSL